MCQSAPPFVSRSFQCSDSLVLTPCRPLCQLWSSLSIWPVLPPTRCSWETTWRSPTANKAFGKEQCSVHAGCFAGCFLPRTFFVGGALWWLSEVEEGQEMVLSYICTASISLTEMSCLFAVARSSQSFQPWAPVGIEVFFSPF